MTIKRISPSLLKVTGATEGDFLVFDSANNSVEFRAGSNAWTNANDYTTYSTLISAINTVSDNVSSNSNNTWVNANDFATYTAVTALIDTVQSNLTSVISSAPTALDTLAEIAAALENDANAAVTLTNQIGTVSANTETNATAINLVQANLSALPDSAANDYTTYTTLSGLIDTVQDNVGSSTSNTQVYVGDTLVSNTAVIFEAGSGTSLASNADTGVVTFSTQMGNATSETISVDGSANTFTMSKESANTTMLLVFYNGLALDHDEYEVSGTTLTLANIEPLISSSKLQVRHFDFFDMTGVVEGSSGSSWTFGGESYGYATSGYRSPPATYTNSIDKFSLVSDSSSTSVGSTSPQGNFITFGGGFSSSSKGYTARTTIFSFPFASDTDLGTTGVTHGTASTRKAEHSSGDNGYISGGAPVSDSIAKFPFATESGVSDVGELTRFMFSSMSAASSLTHGYIAGGQTSPSDPAGGESITTIQKFSFTSDGGASNIGDLTVSQGTIGAGHGGSSPTSGYAYSTPAPTSAKIQKYPFASDTNSSGFNGLLGSSNYQGVVSGIDAAYITGGYSPNSDVIQKHNFPNDTSGTDIAELGSGAQYYHSSQQI